LEEHQCRPNFLSPGSGNSNQFFFLSFSFYFDSLKKQKQKKTLNFRMTSESHWNKPSQSEAYKKYRSGYSKKTFAMIRDYLRGAWGRAGPYHRLVDVGCGTGQVMQALAPDFEQLVGVDLSETQVAEAKTNTYQTAVIATNADEGNPAKPSSPSAAAVQFVVAPAESFTLPDPAWEGTVDLVTCASTLHWLNAAAFALRISQVLRPGGLLIVWTPKTLGMDPPAANAALEKFFQFFKDRQCWPAETQRIEDKYIHQIPEMEDGSKGSLKFLRTEELLEHKGPLPVTNIVQFLSTLSPVNIYNAKKKEHLAKGEPIPSEFAEDPVQLLRQDLLASVETAGTQPGVEASGDGESAKSETTEPKAHVNDWIITTPFLVFQKVDG
jgi:SAM-dependent methyltransferase